MSSPSSDIYNSFLPVYDTIPQDWEQAREMLVEALKMNANLSNVKEIGWYLTEEVVSGKQFDPGSVEGQYRTIFRKVVDFSPLAIGVNSKAHNLAINDKFRLINLYGAYSDKVAFTGGPINQPNISYDATNIIITSTVTADYAQAVIEYIKEE